MIASGCGYVAGCHPHRHAWIHGHSTLSVLLFVLLAVIVGHRITDGEWG